MSILSRHLTYADLERAQETSDERLELIEGEIIVTPAPAPWHQLIVHRLAVLLDDAIVATGLGLVMESPLNVFLAEQNVPQPDLIVLLRDRVRQFGAKRVEGSPNLAVEILSPSSGVRDRETKRDVYARFAVPEYWIVDPDTRSITIFSSPQDGRYQVETVTNDVAVSATIPGLLVELAALFAPVFDD